MTNESNLVLLTGGTGFIGVKILHTLLSRSYPVRLAVRSESKSASLLSNPALASLNKNDLISFVTIPDLTVPGAFDSALEGVKYVIHVASPMPTSAASKEQTLEQQHAFYVEPAVAATLSLLESAAKTPIVKKVVITSSIIAVIRPSVLLGQESTDEVFSAASPTPDEILPPYNEPSGLLAYVASKIAALRATDQWVASHPDKHFDIVNVYPGYVFGRNLLAEKSSDMWASTDAMLLRIPFGIVKEGDGSPPAAAAFAHLDDVAEVHVRALDENNPAVRGYKAFAVFSNGPEGKTWNDIRDVTKEKFPREIADGVIPNDGALETIPVNADASDTEKELGFKFKHLGSMVEDVVGQFLELKSKE